eukprot:1614044-Rhodomonas_salina.1
MGPERGGYDEKLTQLSIHSGAWFVLDFITLGAERTRTPVEERHNVDTHKKKRSKNRRSELVRQIEGTFSWLSHRKDGSCPVVRQRGIPECFVTALHLPCDLGEVFACSSAHQDIFALGGSRHAVREVCAGRTM